MTSRERKQMELFNERVESLRARRADAELDAALDRYIDSSERQLDRHEWRNADGPVHCPDCGREACASERESMEGCGDGFEILAPPVE